ncbi:MAG: hypothetical protein HYZ75_02205 [Elusimicrobia bacterium]|nr:hypothetical protein [Elusimicrobiota bacterium]
MKWPGIQRKARSNLAPALRGRVDFVVGRYSETHDGAYGRAWITVDGEKAPSCGGGDGYPAAEFILDMLEYLDVAPSEALRSETALWRALAVMDRRMTAAALEVFDTGTEPDAAVREFYALRMAS